MKFEIAIGEENEKFFAGKSREMKDRKGKQKGKNLTN